jgi:hypothetical protein
MRIREHIPKGRRQPHTKAKCFPPASLRPQLPHPTYPSLSSILPIPRDSATRREFKSYLYHWASFVFLEKLLNPCAQVFCEVRITGLL